MKFSRMKNGVRVLLSPRTDTREVSVSVFVNVGAANEDDQNHGVSHFLEHMAFKGTTTRTGPEIMHKSELLGADVNAYTSRTQTCYYMTGLSEHMPVFVDLLSDIVQNSTLPAEEVENERKVIIQEWTSYDDSPSFKLHSGMSIKTAGDNPWGRPIIGTHESITALSRDDLLAYMQQHYVGDNIIVAIAGRIDEEAAMALVEEKFASVRSGPASTRTKIGYSTGEHIEVDDSIKQSQVVMHYKNTTERTDRDFFVGRVAMRVIGSGMSSPLFTEIREKRGLVYSVYGGSNSSAGTVVIGGDMTPENIPEFFSAVGQVIKRAMTDTDPDALERAKNQLMVATVRMNESQFSLMETNATRVFDVGTLADLDSDLEQYRSVTMDEVQSFFTRVLTQKPSVGIIGREMDAIDYHGILTAELV